MESSRSILKNLSTLRSHSAPSKLSVSAILDPPRPSFRQYFRGLSDLLHPQPVTFFTKQDEVRRRLRIRSTTDFEIPKFLKKNEQYSDFRNTELCAYPSLKNHFKSIMVDVSRNNFSSLEYFSKLRKLKYLYVNDNDISIIDYIPFRLETLHISGNRVEGWGSHNLPYNLKQLVMRNNYISSFFCFPEFSRLEELDLRENTICDLPFFKEIVLCFCPELKKLNGKPVKNDLRRRIRRIRDEVFGSGRFVQLTTAFQMGYIPTKFDGELMKEESKMFQMERLQKTIHSGFRDFFKVVDIQIEQSFRHTLQMLPFVIVDNRKLEREGFSLDLLPGLTTKTFRTKGKFGTPPILVLNDKMKIPMEEIDRDRGIFEVSMVLPNFEDKTISFCYEYSDGSRTESRKFKATSFSRKRSSGRGGKYKKKKIGMEIAWYAEDYGVGRNKISLRKINSLEYQIDPETDAGKKIRASLNFLVRLNEEEEEMMRRKAGGRPSGRTGLSQRQQGGTERMNERDSSGGVDSIADEDSRGEVRGSRRGRGRKGSSRPVRVFGHDLFQVFYVDPSKLPNIDPEKRKRLSDEDFKSDELVNRYLNLLFYEVIPSLDTNAPDREVLVDLLSEIENFTGLNGGYVTPLEGRQIHMNLEKLKKLVFRVETLVKRNYKLFALSELKELKDILSFDDLDTLFAMVKFQTKITMVLKKAREELFKNREFQFDMIKEKVGKLIFLFGKVETYLLGKMKVREKNLKKE